MLAQAPQLVKDQLAQELVANTDVWRPGVLPVSGASRRTATAALAGSKRGEDRPALAVNCPVRTGPPGEDVW